jgi:hypothetical protein
LNVFAVGVDGGFGVVELDHVLPRDRRFAR